MYSGSAAAPVSCFPVPNRQKTERSPDGTHLFDWVGDICGGMCLLEWQGSLFPVQCYSKFDLLPELMFCILLSWICPIGFFLFFFLNFPALIWVMSPTFWLNKMHFDSVPVLYCHLFLTWKSLMVFSAASFRRYLKIWFLLTPHWFPLQVLIFQRWCWTKRLAQHSFSSS